MRPERETRAEDMAGSRLGHGRYRDPEPARAAMYANNNIPPNVLSSKVDDFFARRAPCRRLFKEGHAASCQVLAGTAPTPDIKEVDAALAAETVYASVGPQWTAKRANSVLLKRKYPEKPKLAISQLPMLED